MGHIRIPWLPDTAPWRLVVGLIAEGADVATVASATTSAAATGLELAHDDDGLAYSVWLLTQLVLAARSSDFSSSLNTAGIEVPAEPGVFDLIAGFTEAVDRHMTKTGGRTDFGEMAQMAAVETLASLIGPRSASLFGTTHEEIKDTARSLSTKQGFATLAHDFFSRFGQRILTYHLGRELSQHVGGNGRFQDPSSHNEFLSQLETHCRQVALIVKEYAGGWYSKANFEGGISPVKARHFANYCLTKLRLELQKRGERVG